MFQVKREPSVRVMGFCTSTLPRFANSDSNVASDQAAGSLRRIVMTLSLTSMWPPSQRDFVMRLTISREAPALLEISWWAKRSSITDAPILPAARFRRAQLPGRIREAAPGSSRFPSTREPAEPEIESIRQQ